MEKVCLPPRRTLGGLAALQPAPQHCGEPNTFFIFYSRKDPPRRAGRRDAKKLWSAQFDFRRPSLLRAPYFFLLAMAVGRGQTLCGLAALQPAPQNYGAPIIFSFFILAKTHRGGQAGRTQSRKGIVVHQKKNPPCPLIRACHAELREGVAPSAPLKKLEE